MDIDDNTRVKAPNCMRIKVNPNPTRAKRPGPRWIWISRDLSAIWRLNECVIIPEFNIVDILLISDILLCDLMFIL